MKYLRGYIVAAVFLVLTLALTAFAAAHTTLVDMVYPYASRLIQSSLAQWVSGIDICLWQLIVVLMGVALLASILVMILLRWNFFQWLGWVLTVCSFIYMMHTGIYGLNYYAGPLTDDIRLTEADLSITKMAEATTYFRDKANELATQVPRNEDGTPETAILRTKTLPGCAMKCARSTKWSGWWISTASSPAARISRTFLPAGTASTALPMTMPTICATARRSSAWTSVT